MGSLLPPPLPPYPYSRSKIEFLRGEDMDDPISALITERRIHCPTFGRSIASRANLIKPLLCWRRKLPCVVIMGLAICFPIH